MAPGTLRTAHPATREPITWRQIGVGYVLLVCIALGLAVAFFDPHGPSPATDPIRSIVVFAVFATLYGIWKLMEPAMTRASTWLGPTPEGQLHQKRLAVGAMWLLSLALCAASIRVTQLVNPW